MEIKVLALNDDNHEISFATKDYVYGSVRDFMEVCLLNPHNDTYVVRGVYICDPSESFADMDEDEWIETFDLVATSSRNIIGDNREELLAKKTEYFEKLWEEGNKYW
jgi:hypothetical protein